MARVKGITYVITSELVDEGLTFRYGARLKSLTAVLLEAAARHEDGHMEIVINKMDAHLSLAVHKYGFDSPEAIRARLENS